MTTATYPPGTRFQHPGQGVCTVTAATAKAVRYSFPSPGGPGFPPRYATTTPQALTAVIAAGVITLLP